MRPSQGPIIIITLKRTISAGEITRISHGAKIIMTTQGQTIPTTSNLPLINTIFLAKFHTLPTEVFPEKIFNLEILMENFMQNIGQMVSKNM